MKFHSRTQKKRPKSRRCFGLARGLEPLESRQMLAMMVAPWLNSNHASVPQDSPGAEIPIYADGNSDIQFTQPDHGELAFSDQTGSFTYRPDPGYVGADGFTYNGTYYGHNFTREFSLTVTETVFAVPDWTRVAPGSTSYEFDLLENDYVFGPENGTRYDSLSDEPYFVNWTGYDRWHRDATALTLVDVWGANHGETRLSEDGRRLVYEPDAGFAGTDPVQYIVEDGYGHRSQATVTIEVADVSVGTTGYTSESEFVHDQIDAWMEWHAGNLTSPYYSTINHCYSDDTTLIEMTTAVDASLNKGSFDQVAGVSEGDIVKTSGDYLYIASRPGHEGKPDLSELTIVDLSHPTAPRVVSTISFDGEILDLYVTEGRVTAITQDAPYWNWCGYGRPNVNESTIHVLDVSDADQPQLVYQTVVDGTYHSSRVMGDHLYFISSTSYGPMLPAPTSLVDTPEVVTSPSMYVDQLIEQGADAFLPHFEIWQGGDSQIVRMSDWTQIEPGAVDTSPVVVITTLDLTGTDGTPIDVDTTRLGESSQGPWSLTHVAPTIYVSTEAIYLLGHGEIAKFSFESDGAGVDLSATGHYEGHILNQFSIDEYQGNLRIATTGLGWTDQVDVHVYGQVGDSLEIAGSLIDIAPGEQVYATRFDGERGFVVTFRTVDPLFVIDFSSPTEPVLAGQLKVPGFSNYLQVIDKDHVIGVGRNADESSGLYDELQISLFDVGDPADPQLIDRYTFEGGRDTWSPLIESAWQLGDHQAFHYVAEAGILALPFHTGSPWGFDSSHDGLGEGQKSAVRFFQIDVDRGMEELGQVDFASRALRSLRFDEYVVSLSSSELKVTALNAPTTVLASLELTGDEAVAVGDLPFIAAAHDGSTLDVNGDGVISPLDALILINHSHNYGFATMTEAAASMSRSARHGVDQLDVNRDGAFSPLDALLIVNSLDSGSVTVRAGLSASSADWGPALVAQRSSPGTQAMHIDALFAIDDEGDDEDELADSVFLP